MNDSHVALSLGLALRDMLSRHCKLHCEQVDRDRRPHIVSYPVGSLDRAERTRNDWLPLEQHLWLPFVAFAGSGLLSMFPGGLLGDLRWFERSRWFPAWTSMEAICVLALIGHGFISSESDANIKPLAGA